MKAANTPAKCDIRVVDEDSPKVSENRRAKFHNLVMLIMHVSHRGRRDPQPTVDFLSHRANECSEEHCEKLRRLIRFMIGSMDEVACIGATDL